MSAAGILYYLDTKIPRVLLLKRSDAETNYAGYWAIPGGGIDPGETAEEAATRESREEIGVAPEALETIDVTQLRDGGEYTTFRALVQGEFTPTLNFEHSSFGWFELSALPSPIHPGVNNVLQQIANKDRLNFAFDSVRTLDVDGRLHVSITPISKATVNPYRGDEIPDWDVLGLNPQSIYKMFRDPEELAAAAPTFNNIQLMDNHVAVDSTNPEKERIVGSTGTDAAFDGTYLTNSLVVWDAVAIEGIQSGEQKELSASYRYKPDMTAGVWSGQKYDGVMRGIVANHVALVEKGRAGPDVVVGDAALKEIDMAKAVTKLPSRTASRVRAALGGYFAPKLAADAKPDFGKIVAGVTYKGLLAKDGKTIDKAKLAALAKLARDGLEAMVDPAAAAAAGGAAKAIGPDDVIMKLIDVAVGNAAPAEIEADTMDPAVVAQATENPALDDPAAAGGDNAELMAFLQTLGLDEATIAKIVEMVGKGGTAKPAEPAEPEKTPADADLANKDDPDDKKAKDDAMPANAVTTTAMDAAIRKESAATETRVRRHMTALAEAREFVRPWVGSISLANDSVPAIYHAALKATGTDADTVQDIAALRLLLEKTPQPGARVERASDSDLAMDSDTSASLAKRFPHAAAINIG